MPLNAGEAGAHEEEHVARLAAALDGAGVHLGPQRRPGVVHELGVDAVGEVNVDGQILAEIGHPAGEPEVEHVLADHAFGKPVGGLRIGEIDDAAVELAEIDEGRPAGRVRREIAGRLRFREQRAVDGKIGVHVAEEADATIREARRCAGAVPDNGRRSPTSPRTGVRRRRYGAGPPSPRTTGRTPSRRRR